MPLPREKMNNVSGRRSTRRGCRGRLTCNTLPLCLQIYPACSPHPPRHCTALHNAHDLAADLAVDDRPPRDKGELMALLDHGELPAR